MKKKIVAVLSLFLVVSLVLGMNAFAINDQTPAYKAHLSFGTDGKFTILQMADIQDGPVMMPIVKDFLRDIVPATNPDLIVLTGDNFSGGSCRTGIRALDRILVKIAISQYMSVLNSYGVPIAMVFGNHDAETTVNKEQQLEIYSTYANSISYDEGDDIYGRGNYNVPIYASENSDDLLYNLWMIDSNMYDDINGGYDYVHQSQIDWYVRVSNQLKAQNNGIPVPSLMFQHIIVPDIFDAFLQVDAGTEGAIAHSGNHYVLNPANTKNGVMHECPCPPITNSGQFDAVVNQGDVVAMAFGHDHTNTFVVEHRGVDLIATPGVTFASYGDEGRGARVFTLDKNDLSTYEEYLVTYDDLYDGDETAALRFTMYGRENGAGAQMLAGVRYLFKKSLSLVFDLIKSS
ncbi:MAG TPA: metallophosphoesterase [Clostridia bacterium]|nr:metallophosphoesterase [Clostridia bacterium]